MDEARAEAAPIGAKAQYRRFNLAVRRPHNWFELIRFCVVGATGYVINLAVFFVADRWWRYQIAFAVAFAVAATSNFIWNRLWTFRVTHGVPHHQYARFLTVSAIALIVDLVILTTLVEVAQVPGLLAAAIAILIATPISFLGNKVWSFR